MLIVTQSFMGHGYDFPAVGSKIDPPEPIRSYLISINVAVPLETKVMPLPAEVKKKEPSVSLPAVPAPVKKTRRRSKKSVTKR